MQLIRGTMRGIDPRTRLSGGVNFRQLRKIYLIRALVHSIPIEGNYKIRVARRIGQRALPKAFGIRRPLPRAMIFVIHHLTQWNGRLLHDADMFSQFHQKS